jgi:hypothetical protein
MPVSATANSTMAMVSAAELAEAPTADGAAPISTSSTTSTVAVKAASLAAEAGSTRMCREITAPRSLYLSAFDIKHSRFSCREPRRVTVNTGE